MADVDLKKITEIAAKYTERCMRELEASHDAELTIHNAIDEAICEFNFGVKPEDVRRSRS